MRALPEIIKHIPAFMAVLIVSESPNNKADDVKEFIAHHHLKDHILWIP
ncbi:MAG: hypothetical protein WCJ45_03330 [bacterium]